MKYSLYTLLLILTCSILFTSCEEKEAKENPKPLNYIVIIDLSDRILVSEQLDKDFYLIEKYFKIFEENSRRNLVLTSKNRFSVKIIPQKNSPLKVDQYEDLLQLYLDETDIKDKNKSLLTLAETLPKILQSLKKDALFSTSPRDYFGVDIWSYLHDNGLVLSKKGYDSTILVLTDGYFDFESQTHVIQNKNQYTSTRFLNELISTDWKEISEAEEYGLLPINLEKNSKWIVAGLSGKKVNDILQTEKITYFWKKWLNISGVTSTQFILNSSKTEMSSNLLEELH